MNLAVFLQIFLVVSLVFSFSYILNNALGDQEVFSSSFKLLDTQDYNLQEKSWYNIQLEGYGIRKRGVFDYALPIYSKLLKIIFSENTFVSAAVTESVYTCLEDNNGFICQEYSSSVCDNECSGTCIPTTRDKVSQCKIGTCYSPIEGTCQPSSPKESCEENFGEWFDDPFGNIQQCQQGCCLLSGGDEAVFSTERECSAIAESSGTADGNYEFRPEIKQEWACIALSKTQEEGACVFQSEIIGEKNNCKFGTRANCVQSGGEFYADALCSNPELDTRCEKQSSSQCVDGKDEIYWFDSCGNRENIYSANKVQSYNDGFVLSKSESCEIGNVNDDLANQEICGNCAYIKGSSCGAKTSNEKLSDSSQDFVCRDLSCIDSSGQERDNGESWCEYNSAIGVESGAGNKERSVDSVGSRHFRFSCLDGEVRTDACADFRNEVCVENQLEKDGGGTFSSAACKVNGWQQCLQYNTEIDKTKSSRDTRDNKCEQDSNCFVKEVNVDSNFKFNLCAPKNPPGFNLKTNGEGAERICSLANQKCTVVYVKGFSGWKCKANCDCRTEEFAQQMNDLCISLGDCGAAVNYQGELTENYKVKSSQKLGNKYLSELEEYSEPIEGKYARVGNNSLSGRQIGIPEGLGNPGEINMEYALGTMGMAGIAFTLLSKTTTGASLLGDVGLGFLTGSGGSAAAADLGLAAKHGVDVASAIGVQGNVLTPGADIGKIVNFGSEVAGQSGGGLGPGLGGLANALGAIAAIYSAYSLLTTALDVGDPIAIGLVVAAIGAGFVFSSLGGFGVNLGLISFNPIFLIAVAIIFAVLGFGKSKKVTVAFECYPWQAPFGGEQCDKCGSDGYPCSRYSCQSLGQTCELLNENTGSEECVDIAPDDVSAPIIKERGDSLSENYEIVDVGNNGFSISRTDGVNDGCVAANEDLTFGIELNEPGRCRFDVERKSFDEMEFEFGGRNLFLWNHTNLYSTPNLASLGLPGYDPNAKTEHDLYVRCKDASGNENGNDYVINFCVRPGEDLTAPKINSRSPKIEWITHNQTELNATVYTNEPSQCKWSFNDKDYDSMENLMSCENDVEDRELFGWACNFESDVSTLSKEDSKIYVRCEDQPWLIEDSGNGNSVIRVDEGDGNFREIQLDERRERNVNTESYEFFVRRSQSELKIAAAIPIENELITSGFEPVSVEVILRTVGGVDGNAICSYKFGNQYVAFSETTGDEHRQVFDQMIRGHKELPIMCKDIAGNVAEKIMKFDIEVDDDIPLISRIYNTGGTLNVVTNEPAECAYIIGGDRRRGNQCGFTFGNGDNSEGVIVMNGAGIEHTSNFNEINTYYIKCKDSYGNMPGVCSAIVRPES